MIVHNPPNLRLPPLILEKHKEREEMEKRKDITSLINSKRLLSHSLYNSIQSIIKISENIDAIVSLLSPEVFGGSNSPLADEADRIPYEEDLETGIYSDEIFGKKEYQGIFDQTPLTDSHLLMLVFSPKFRLHQWSKKIQGFVALALHRRNRKLLSRLKKLNKEIQNQITKAEQTNKIELDILSPTIYFICKRCLSVVTRDKFRATNCVCGIEIASITKTEQNTINSLSQQFCNFMKKNYWLEYGVDYLLRKKNFQTLCGYYVLGHSGNFHEIDCIGESKTNNFRFFCECKSGDVGINDIFVLAGKMADIGCSRGYVFTNTKSVSKEIIFLARSRNISVIADVLGSSNDELLAKITD